MNCKDDVVEWPHRYHPIPKPYYVVRCGEHYEVCTLDENYNLLEEVTHCHCDPYTVRRWALEITGWRKKMKVHHHRFINGRFIITCDPHNKGEHDYYINEQTGKFSCRRCRRVIKRNRFANYKEILKNFDEESEGVNGTNPSDSTIVSSES